MVDRNIINKLGISKEQLDQQVSEMFGDSEQAYLEEVLTAKVDLRVPGTILKGTIVTQIGNDVIVEIGLKSEGVVESSEFDDPDEIEPGKEVEVLLEDIDSRGVGLIPLSKRKADRIRGWETIIATKKEGDIVTGKVIRRIKGGLLVDIGVPVFLPASQVDIRKPGDISRFIGKEVESVILKIDVEGRNIVISRRKLIEEERRSSKDKVLEEIEVGQTRKGIVKNIADFGVFVDLGGVDGLLHISDLSWGRISHPSEVVELDQEIECVVIGVDKSREKISLGLKQKTSSPWEEVEDKYTIGSRIKGTVVNVMNYGVFVRLEDGIEGLVHISEMSWTKRLTHPNELLNLGDEIEVVVLSVNKDKQEISLGLKQTETNPWATASQKYPAGTIVTGIVRSLTNFGAFVEIEEGIDGMIHVSDLSWTRKYSHPSEMLQKGQEIKCVVQEVNEEKHRVSLGIKQMAEDPWIRVIPEKYIPGHIIKGKITKLTNFGVFVELEPELEGLLHISELADHKIEKPQDIVSDGEEIEVKILKVDTESRKIGLSLRRAQWAAEESEKSEKPEKVKKESPTPAVIQTALSGDDVTQVAKSDESTDEVHQATETENREVESETAESVEAASLEQDEEPQAKVTEENHEEENAEKSENKSKKPKKVKKKLPTPAVIQTALSDDDTQVAKSDESTDEVHQATETENREVESEAAESVEAASLEQNEETQAKVTEENHEEEDAEQQS